MSSFTPVWSPGRLVNRSLDWSNDRSIEWSVGHLINWLVGGSVNESISRSVALSICRLVDRYVRREEYACNTLMSGQTDSSCCANVLCHIFSTAVNLCAFGNMLFISVTSNSPFPAKQTWYNVLCTGKCKLTFLLGLFWLLTKSWELVLTLLMITYLIYACKNWTCREMIISNRVYQHMIKMLYISIAC